MVVAMPRKILHLAAR